MAEVIDMPKLSDTMTEGTLVKWLKKEGDAVAPGDALAEVETDKATMELENFEDGVLLKQYVSEGAKVKVGDPIAAVGEEGEEAPEAGGPQKEESKGEKEEEKKEPKEEKAKEPEEKKAEKEEPKEEEKEEKKPKRKEGERIKASPLAKKVAEDKGLDLEDIEGSGPGGRIVKADVLAALEKGPAKKGRKKAAPSARGEFIAKDESIPVSNMRATIAKHLHMSKSKIPHFYLNIDVDAKPLMDARKALNANIGHLWPDQEGAKFTVNDFVLKATTEALRRVPKVNASWQEEEIKQFGSVDLAFGVAVEEGLVTPVIRDAQNKSIMDISTEVKELVGKAKNKKLKPEEMTGSTFTVTNLGMYGIEHFYGIINPPNAGILSVGAVAKKPIVDENDNIVIGHRMNIGFSGDHRVVDGAMGAQFLQALKEIIETPALLLV